MSQNKPDQEPSIEEILSSIRQIISEDDESDIAEPEEAAEPEADPDAGEIPEPEAAAPETPDIPEAAVAAEEDDVFELTDPVDDFDENFVEPEPERVDLDFVEREEVPVPPADEADDQQKFVAATEPDAGKYLEDVPAEDGVFSNFAAEATLQSFAMLASNVQMGNGGVTLEALVREMLRPMLRQWLDQNLPDIIERLVQQELEKISGRVRK